MNLVRGFHVVSVHNYIFLPLDRMSFTLYGATSQSSAVSHRLQWIHIFNGLSRKLPEVG